MTKKIDLTTIILTYNEEIHIRRCLENVCSFSKKVYIIDSPSTDRTEDICRSLTIEHSLKDGGGFIGQTSCGCTIEFVVHKYPGNQAEQFNWTLDNCNIDTEWVLRMDADEYCTPELIREMEEKLPSISENVSAVVLPLGRAFMGRVLKHGIVDGIKMIRLFRNGKVRYEQRLMDEHLEVLDGETVTFQGKFVDDNRLPLAMFVNKHNNYSNREAAVLLDAEYELKDIDVNLKDEGEKAKEVMAKRAQKAKYAKMPLFWRAFAYFVYRYVFKFGFLDGKEGFCWDFFQGLWYRMLVDAKVFEAKKACGGDKEKIRNYIDKEWGIKL